MRVETGDGVWSWCDVFVTYPLNFRDLTYMIGPNKLIHARRGG